jgi:dTDP-glucose pyrophosphorylase
MIRGGVDKICFVIAPGKSDILGYFGSSYGGANIAYVVQARPAGLCDAVFSAHALCGPNEPVVVGLPDTIWFPEAALRLLPDNVLSFLLFPVDRPDLFDAVATDAADHVQEIQVKRQDASSNWIWGAFKMAGSTYGELRQLWRKRAFADEYFGTLVNAYLELGGTALGIKAGESYVDVGTLNGYRTAMTLLMDKKPALSQPRPRSVGYWPSGRGETESQQPSGSAT